MSPILPHTFATVRTTGIGPIPACLCLQRIPVDMTSTARPSSIAAAAEATPNDATGTARLVPSRRLSDLPTYVFAWLDELKAEARSRGASLIDLGMGNPDQPTPPAI